MTKQGELSKRIDEVLSTADYQVEELVLSITSEFIDRMESTLTTRTELARRLGVKLPRVTRILQGNDNFTLRTVVHMAHALDCKLVFTLAPCGAETRWLHYFPGGKAEATASSGPASLPCVGDYSSSPVASGTTPIGLEAKAG